MAENKTNKDIDFEIGEPDERAEITIENPNQEIKTEIKPEVKPQEDNAAEGGPEPATEATAPQAGNTSGQTSPIEPSSTETSDQQPSSAPEQEQEAPDEQPATEESRPKGDEEDEQDNNGDNDLDRRNEQEEPEENEPEEQPEEGPEEEPAKQEPTEEEQPEEAGEQSPENEGENAQPEEPAETPEAEGPESAPETAGETAGEAAPEATAETGALEGAGAEEATGAGVEAAGAEAASGVPEAAAATGLTPGGAAAATGTAPVGAAAATGAAPVGAAAATGALPGAAGAAGAGAAAAGTGAAAAGGTAAAGTGIAVGWPVILIIIGVVLLVILVIWIVSLFGPKTSVNPNDPETKAQIEQIEGFVSSGQLSFYQASDLEKIKQGKIGNSTLQIITFLASQHEAMLINYNGQEKNTDASGNKIAGANLPFEMDVSSVDKIKCTDTSNNSKFKEFPIYLTSQYDWGQNASNNNNIKCAVGYYPGIDPKKEGEFAAKFGPGEFAISEIGTAGKQAAQEKLAEITAESLDAAKTIAEAQKELSENKSTSDVKPASISLDGTYANQNMKGSGQGIIGELQQKISETFSATAQQGGDGVKAVDNLPFGFHISFL